MRIFVQLVLSSFIALFIISCGSSDAGLGEGLNSTDSGADVGMLDTTIGDTDLDIAEDSSDVSVETGVEVVWCYDDLSYRDYYGHISFSGTDVGALISDRRGIEEGTLVCFSARIPEHMTLEVYVDISSRSLRDGCLDDAEGCDFLRGVDAPDRVEVESALCTDVSLEEQGYRLRCFE